MNGELAALVVVAEVRSPGFASFRSPGAFGGELHALLEEGVVRRVDDPVNGVNRRHLEQFRQLRHIATEFRDVGGVGTCHQVAVFEEHRALLCCDAATSADGGRCLDVVNLGARPQVCNLFGDGSPEGSCVVVLSQRVVGAGRAQLDASLEQDCGKPAVVRVNHMLHQHILPAGELCCHVTAPHLERVLRPQVHHAGRGKYQFECCECPAHVEADQDVVGGQVAQ